MELYDKKCHQCGGSYTCPQRDDIVVFCPHCGHSDIVDLSYLPSPDTVCLIFTGDEEIARVSNENGTYRLKCGRYGIDEELSDQYVPSVFDAGRMISSEMEES